MLVVYKLARFDIGFSCFIGSVCPAQALVAHARDFCLPRLQSLVLSDTAAVR